MVLLFIRFAVACYFLGIYLTNRESLDITGFPEWKGLYVVGGIVLLTMLARFFPLPIYFTGAKKHLKHEFQPTKEYQKDPKLSTEDYKKIHQLNKGAFRTFLFYIGITGVFFVLYFLGIIGAPEILLLSMLYYVLDRFCIGVFCPIRVLFLKSKCCTDCRIYNWDNIMIVFPLIILPGVISWTLVLVATVYTFVWEISYHVHPERFLERTNAALRCENCPKDNCPKRRRALFKNAFSKEE